MICFNSIVICVLCFLFIYSVVSKKPRNKRRQATWRLECELGIITDPDCPVDGGWSPWTPWSACKGVCDDIGQRRRVRECANPPASQDGLPCSGSGQEIEPCYLTNCTVDDFRKLVEGDSARSDALRQLETVPSIMEKCLKNYCAIEEIANDLAIDNTWQINTEILWNAIQCVKHDIGCDVIGEWGVWAPWSECGARCGLGLRWRFKRCDTPPPSARHLICSGSPLQYEDCIGDQCAIDKRFSDHDTSGTWSDWSAWSECTEKCGKGVRRRQRTCVEKQTLPEVIPWGTHCRGQYYEMQTCSNDVCVLNGGWSGWSAWGPCSQTCGAGKRYRRRSCTRPMPSGGGSNCYGPKSEVGTCYLTPCDSLSHVVALFNGDSFIHYNFTNKRSSFFHFFIRFMPLSPHGTLVRRGSSQEPEVRLSLHKWHVCLDASGSSKLCSLPRTCLSTAIVPAAWHTILLTVTNELATIRIDDNQTPVSISFPCDPALIDHPVNIVVGEKFYGEVQELILNFMPLSIFSARDRELFRSDFVPSAISNIAYEKGNTDEGFLILENDQYIRVPCFERQDEWQLELTVKTNRDLGILLYMEDESNHCFFVVLHNMRIKMKVKIDEYRSEVISSNEYLLNQWLSISFSKRQATNAIEAIINSGERLHISLIDETERKRRYSRARYMFYDFEKNCSIYDMFHKRHDIKQNINQTFEQNNICYGEIYVAGLPMDVIKKLCTEMKSEITPFFGVIASLKMNDKLLDLHEFTIESDRDDKIQVSSRTASISGLYREISWGDSNQLNLTCLYARSKSLAPMAYWLNLDTELYKTGKSDVLQVFDNGKILKLTATAVNNIRGFYTCRAHHNNRKRNIVTYGVLGKHDFKLSGPDFVTIAAVFTTTSLVFFTLSWLIIELYYDVRDGYGFFRDVSLSSNSKLELSHNSEDVMSKGLRRRRKRFLVGKTSFSTQNIDRLMDIVKEVTNTQEEYTTSEPNSLPPLPTTNNLTLHVTYDVNRCEPSYLSSPLHGTSNVTDNKLTPCSSVENSPREICSRLLMTTYRNSCGESLSSKQKFHRDNIEYNKSNVHTKSSQCILSPAKKIIKKFRELKSDD